MARGEGRIFQPTYRAKDGSTRMADTWAIKYYDRRTKTHLREYGFATEAEAARQLRARLTDQDRGLLATPSVDKVTFEDLAKMIEDDYIAKKRKTLRRLQELIAHLKRTFGGMRAVDITTDRITTYARTRLQEEAAPGTVNRELAALRRMFKLAVRAKRISRDTEPYFPMLGEDNVRKGFFEWPQFEALTKNLPPRFRWAITVAYITGWRLNSEVLTRCWKHVDLDAGWLRIEPGEDKNKAGRMFPIDVDPRLRAVLLEAKQFSDRLKRRGIISPWVFGRKTSGRRIKSFYKVWYAACRKAGFPDRIPHDFRRSAVRNLVRAGVSQVAIMKMVGMKTDSIFRRYAIVDETMLLEAAAKVRARGLLGQ